MGVQKSRMFQVRGKSGVIMNLIELKGYLKACHCVFSLSEEGKLQCADFEIMPLDLLANIRYYKGAFEDALLQVPQVPQVPQVKPIQQQPAHRERPASQPLSIVKKNVVRENTSTANLGNNTASSDGRDYLFSFRDEDEEKGV